MTYTKSCRRHHEDIFLLWIMLVLRRYTASRTVLKRCSGRDDSLSAICRRWKVHISDERKNLLASELSTSLGCTRATARAIVRRIAPKLSLETNELRESVTFCKVNLPFRDLIDTPVVMTLTQKILNERFSCLLELGIRNIQAWHIINFNYIMSQTPEQLKHCKMVQLPKDESQITCDYFGNCASLQSAMKSKMLAAYSNNSTLASLKAELNAQFLSHRLQCPYELVNKYMKKYSSLRSVSIRGIESTISVLMDDYGLEPAKISHSLFVLVEGEHKLREFCKVIPDIVGVDVRTIAKKLPAVLGKSPESLKNVEDVLREFAIAGEQLSCCPKALLMHPETLRRRLQDLHESEDFRLLKKNRDFLWLVIHHKWLHHRVKLLKDAGLPCSLSAFVLSESNFRKRLKLNKGSTYAKDIVRYLADIFQCSEPSIRKHIRDYPNMNSSSILNAVKVIEFLLGRGVSKEQLWNGLGIVAYDLETVEKYFNNLPYYKEFQPFSEWTGHFNLMHLLIYAIERNSTCAVNLISRPDSAGCEEVDVEAKDEPHEPESREFDCLSDDDEEDDDPEDKELSDVYTRI